MMFRGSSDIIVIVFRSMSAALLTLTLGYRLAQDPVRVVGFFTIQSNIMIWIWWVVQVVAGRSRIARTLDRARTKGGLLLYILITAIIYQTLLASRFSDVPMLEMFVLQMHHAIVPLLFLIDWLIFPRRGTSALCGFRCLPAWLIYPVMYGIFVLIESRKTGRARYPFLPDGRVSEVGWGEFLPLMGIVVCFVLLGSSIILTERWIASLKDHSDASHRKSE